MKLVQVVNIALESLTLNRQRQFIVVACQFVSVNNSSDNLPLVGVDGLVLGAHDGAFGRDLAVSKVVGVTVFKDLLKFNQTLSRDKDVVVLEEVRHVEPLRSLHSHVQQVPRCQLEVIVRWITSSEEANFVCLEGGDNGL